mgnify:CR=1 FL=1
MKGIKMTEESLNFAFLNHKLALQDTWITVLVFIVSLKVKDVCKDLYFKTIFVKS